jgi:anti-sigma-K factor RskA
MRPELEEIKYIEDYLLGNLTDEQKKEFEERLKTDAEFASSVALQKIVTKRVNRLGIKHSVALAHRKHTQRETFLFRRRPNKNFFKSFFTLILILVVGYLIFMSDSKKDNTPAAAADSIESKTKDTAVSAVDKDTFEVMDEAVKSSD